MTREEAIDFLECRRAYYASLSTDPDPNIKQTKVCGYTLAEASNACLMAIEVLKTSLPTLSKKVESNVNIFDVSGEITLD